MEILKEARSGQVATCVKSYLTTHLPAHQFPFIEVHSTFADGIPCHDHVWVGMGGKGGSLPLVQCSLWLSSSLARYVIPSVSVQHLPGVISSLQGLGRLTDGEVAQAQSFCNEQKYVAGHFISCHFLKILWTQAESSYSCTNKGLFQKRSLCIAENSIFSPTLSPFFLAFFATSVPSPTTATTISFSSLLFFLLQIHVEHFYMPHYGLSVREYFVKNDLWPWGTHSFTEGKNKWKTNINLAQALPYGLQPS